MKTFNKMTALIHETTYSFNEAEGEILHKYEEQVPTDSSVVVFIGSVVTGSVNVGAFSHINYFDGSVCDFDGPFQYQESCKVSKKDTVVVTMLEGWVKFHIKNSFNMEKLVYIRDTKVGAIYTALVHLCEKYGVTPEFKFKEEK